MSDRVTMKEIRELAEHVAYAFGTEYGYSEGHLYLDSAYGGHRLVEVLSLGGIQSYTSYLSKPDLALFLRGFLSLDSARRQYFRRQVIAVEEAEQK